MNKNRKYQTKKFPIVNEIAVLLTVVPLLYIQRAAVFFSWWRVTNAHQLDSSSLSCGRCSLTSEAACTHSFTIDEENWQQKKEN